MREAGMTTTKELIERLKACDSSGTMPVILRNRDGSFRDITTLGATLTAGGAGVGMRGMLHPDPGLTTQAYTACLVLD
jgi:hypothetical protein